MSQKKFTKAMLLDCLKEFAGPIAAEQKAHNDRIGEAMMARQAQGLPAFLDQVTPRAAQGGALKKGDLFARVCASLVAAKMGGSMQAGMAYAEKVWGKGPEMEPVMKSLQAGEISGAVLIEETVSNDFIELLTPKTAVRALGAQIEPMPTGSTKIRKETGDLTAHYAGETKPVRSSKPKYGFVDLAAKELICLVALSNRLIRYQTANLEQRVNGRALNRMARREDIAFIRGTGLENTPKGMRSHCLQANLIAATNSATPTLDQVTSDFAKLQTALETADVPMIAPGYMMNARSKIYLENLRTSDGAWAYKAEMLAGSLNGKPFRSTNQIPANLGGGGNESELYLADFEFMVIGETGTMQIAISNEASYVDEEGVVQSAFANRETVIQITTEHDFGVHYEEAIAILTGVKF